MDQLRRSAELGEESLKYIDNNNMEMHMVMAREFLGTVYAEMDNRVSDGDLADALFDKSIGFIEEALRHCTGDARDMRSHLEDMLKRLRHYKENMSHRRKISANWKVSNRKIH